ncbi:MAG: hypothetical protein QOH60_2940 [Mycobacterium sp.]|jgi:hypothetical protein|nr:hypothetical protein [Mycobacterium sp.]
MLVSDDDQGSPPEEVRAQGRNGFGIGALVLGIFSIAASPVLGGVTLGIPGICLGVMGIRNIRQGVASNMAIVIMGMALSALGLILTIAVGIVYIVWRPKLPG